MTGIDLPELRPAWRVKCETCGAIANPDTRRIRHVVADEWPTEDDLRDWIIGDEDTRTTDGCYAEPDGRCEHGHPSWLLALGMI